jgi:hypothetical protein
VYGSTSQPMLQHRGSSTIRAPLCPISAPVLAPRSTSWSPMPGAPAIRPLQANDWPSCYEFASQAGPGSEASEYSGTPMTVQSLPSGMPGTYYGRPTPPGRNSCHSQPTFLIRHPFLPLNVARPAAGLSGTTGNRPSDQPTSPSGALHPLSAPNVAVQLQDSPECLDRTTATATVGVTY